MIDNFALNEGELLDSPVSSDTKPIHSSNDDNVMVSSTSTDDMNTITPYPIDTKGLGTSTDTM